MVGAIIYICIAVVCLAGNLEAFGGDSSRNRPPVILLPNIGGSKLFGNMSDANPPSFLCPKSALNFTLWPNFLYNFAPDCLHYYLKLEYDESSNTMVDNKFVNISAPPAGKTDSIDFVTKFFLYYKSNFYKLSQMLKSMGYKEGVDLFAFPYDWRKFPMEKTKNALFKRLTNLTEQAVAKTGKSAVFVTFSMGSNVLYEFLTEKNQMWKDNHVGLWFSIAGTFGGSNEILMSILTDKPFTSFMVFHRLSVFETGMSSFPSAYYLSHSKFVYGKNKTMVKYGGLNFTYENISELYKTKNISHYDSIQKMVHDPFLNKTPGVNMHCVYSKNHPTLDTIVLEKDFTIKKKKQIQGDGDGLVQSGSLKLCNHPVMKDPNHTMDVEIFNGVFHKEMIYYYETLQSLKKVINKMMKP